MSQAPFSITAGELSSLGSKNIPDELISGRHLIYNSPAALSFNSPGAHGFGVKRAGMAIPGSVMLLVSPGCCGRNTSQIMAGPEYGKRFFYFLLDENDIVTGKHLNKIPQAVKEIVDHLKEKPSMVMICITCVDALLGTDMERVCRKAEKAADIKVRACYMYALTRDSRKPPMVAVRKSVYSLLEKGKKKSDTCNILGFFSPLSDECELYPMLKSVGINSIQEISRCKDFNEYTKLSNANFNLVLNAEARSAADDMEQRLHIPSIELTRLYEIDKIENQYKSLGQVLNVVFHDSRYRVEAQNAVDRFCEKHSDAAISIGSVLNANAFELALALIKYGLTVTEIFADPTPGDFTYIHRIARLRPSVRIYSNLSPTMLHYHADEHPATIAIGEDACWYHKKAAHLPWNDEVQPFGYNAVTNLFNQMSRILEKDKKVVSK